ncbi:MAG TPA: trypsin-like peptidase domain-containing protein [Solirubrobacterales bacterium]|nr:trypsin-like peptidase domain-containing protein [Solirubrobacterales bacterium]
MSAARLWIAALAAALALALAGCGDDSDEGSEAAEPSAMEAGQASGDAGDSADSADSVVIRAENGAFDPQTIYESAAPGVVTVTSEFGPSSGSILDPGGGAGQGSGFVISEDGEIVTNTHVVTDVDQTGTVSGPIDAAREVYVEFPDLNRVEAEVVGIDPFADVALLKVDPAGLDLHPLPLGSETDLEVGEAVAAIGSPFSQQNSLSVGVVSATDRSIPGLTRFGITGAIQTDASINPGNSGGPLLDAEGRVVGINQQIRSSSGGSEGVGFAVPIDLAERSVEQLRDGGEANYAYIGVETRPLYPQLAERLGIEADTGAILMEIIPGGPADDAGLEAGGDTIEFQGLRYATGGDVVLAIDGEAIRTENDLSRFVSLRAPGDEVTLTVARDGEEREVEVTLEERPGP